MSESHGPGGQPTVDVPAPGARSRSAPTRTTSSSDVPARWRGWAAAGTEVHLLVLTDGSKGTWDPDADVRALVTTRHHEQRDAAAALGISDVHFLDLVDGELTGSRAEVAAVCEHLRRVRADVVLGHDPWKQYRLHPDHHRAGTVTIDALVAARDPHFFPRLGEPHRPDRLLLFEAEVIDHVERIDDTFDAKVASLLAHRSQWQSTMAIEAGSPDEQAANRSLRREAPHRSGRRPAPSPAAASERPSS